MKGLFGLGKNKEQKQEKEAKNIPASSHGRWLVQYDRKGCIGAGSCEAVNPERWKVLDTRKAELKGSASKDGIIFELEIGDGELDKMKNAAEGCPKNVIHITNKEFGKKLI